MKSEEKYDIVVIGAGVAGGVFALSQPEDKRILVIERDLVEPDRIIGELMQPGGVLALEKMGLSQLLENIDAQKVEGYKLIKKEESFTIGYNEVDTNIQGVGLRNGKFLTNIRSALAQKSNIDVVEGNVTDLIEKQEKVVGVISESKGNKESYFGELTVVSDGPMSMFRTKLGEVHKKVASHFIGLVLENLTLELPSYGHMIVSGDSPVLVYPISTGKYRILIDSPGDKPPRFGEKANEKFKAEISDILPKEMVPSFIAAVDNGDIKVMPNHSMKTQAFKKEGVVMLGDSLNMRHPLTGGGMTATFSDIICLNKHLKEANDSGKTTSSAIEGYYNDRSKGVETINILANALYRVFRDEDLKEACFEYLSKGGEQASGPLSILAGINKNKQFLLKHFFKVALQHPIHFLTKPKKQFRIYKNATGIIRPILKEEESPALV